MDGLDVCMDWTYAWIGRMHGLDTVLVSIFVMFVHVLIGNPTVYGWTGQCW